MICEDKVMILREILTSWITHERLEIPFMVVKDQLVIVFIISCEGIIKL